MSKLYGTMTGDLSKTEATKRGAKTVAAHVRGWDCGVEVEAFINAEGVPTFNVYVTGGSNGSYRKHVATIADLEVIDQNIL